MGLSVASLLAIGLGGRTRAGAGASEFLAASEQPCFRCCVHVLSIRSSTVVDDGVVRTHDGDVRQSHFI